MATETYIYGEWPSPIGGADVARQQVGLAFPTIDAAGVWWQESRPGEGGRSAIVCQGPDGISRDMLPMPWNARTRVHEYGGKSYLPLPDGFVFANFGDQRLYRCGATADPEPLTPAPSADAAFRFADTALRLHLADADGGVSRVAGLDLEAPSWKRREPELIARLQGVDLVGEETSVETTS